MNKRRIAVLSTILVGGLVFAPVAQAATTCTPAQWPAPAGATSYSVTATDGRGTYVGRASFSDGDGTAIWHAGGRIERVNGFSVSDMNSSGVMSGSVRGTNGLRMAATRTLAGVVTILTTNESYTTAINERGDVAGEWMMPTPAASFAIFWEEGKPDRGHSLTPWGFGSGTGIDDNRIVSYGYQWRGATTEYIARFVPGANSPVLQRYDPDGVDQPMQLFEVDRGLVLATRDADDWPEKDIVLIEAVSGTITTVPGSRGSVTPYDLDNGIVVGDGVNGATMWRNGESVVLPPLAGTTSHAATLVNADGTEVFGTSSTGRAVVWRCSP